LLKLEKKLFMRLKGVTPSQLIWDLHFIAHERNFVRVDHGNHTPHQRFVD
jgi:hypothetical protein